MKTKNGINASVNLETTSEVLELFQSVSEQRHFVELLKLDGGAIEFESESEPIVTEETIYYVRSGSVVGEPYVCDSGEPIEVDFEASAVFFDRDEAMLYAIKSIPNLTA